MADYKLKRGKGVIRTVDGAHIPENDHNRDWRAYQAWLIGGGVPDPADPGPPDLPNPSDELATAIQAATNLAQLKTALLGQGAHRVRAQGIPVEPGP